MSTSRTCLRPVLASSRWSKSICTQCSSSSSRFAISPTNHQRPTKSSSSSRSILPQITQSRSLHTSPAVSISRPLQQVQQQPAPSQISTPPPGFRMNKITRPFVPVATHQRVAFPVNESLEVLNEMYVKLLGEGGDKALSDAVKWQCVTHKSFDHGLQPYNLKLTFFGRRIAYLHTTLHMIHQPIPNNPGTGAVSIGAEAEVSNDPNLLIPAISKRNPLNRVNYISISNHLDSTNLFGIAKASGLVSCLRWKPRDSGDLVGSGVEKVAEDAIFAIIGAVGLQKGGEAARKVMEDRILPSARVAYEGRSRD